jgi:hypothetical protein
LKSTFSFSKFVGTATASVWTVGWAFTATHAINYWMSVGGGGMAFSNSIIPVAGTLLGIWIVFRIFPHEGRRIANTPDNSPSEPWYRHTFGWFALLIWCAVAIIWNLCVFHTTFLAASKGQLLLTVMMVPFSLIGGFLLLLLFTAVGMFLDFLFQIKDDSGVPAPGATPVPPPILAQARRLEPVPQAETATDSNDSPFFHSPVLATLAAVAFINWFVFIAISICLGGNAIGTLPSQDGFILTSHGRHTAVSEFTWVFSLYYSAATLLGFPAIFILFGGKQYLRRPRKGKWYLKLLVAAFLTVWCVGWFGGVGRDFLESRADWIHLKDHPATSHH